MSMAILMLDGNEHTLRRASLSTSGGRDEKWLQELLFRQPDLIPIQEIDPGAGQLIPVCRELALPREGGSVFLDLLCLTRHGRPVLVECKLWRNPQARREVIGQILEYAALLRNWSYGDLTARLKAKLGWNGSNPLFEHVRHQVPSSQEAVFVDTLSRCLLAGDFDLVIAGDGIRTDLEAIAGHLNSRTGHVGRLALVEIQLWEDASGRTLVVPSLPFRTQVLEHRVLMDQAGLPLRLTPVADREEVALDAVVEPDRAVRQNQDRVFWQRFIDSARFDHPDQPPPRHGGRNWVKIDMPAPGRWITAYRIADGTTGLFLTLVGEVGEAVYRALEAEQAELDEELEMPVQFKIEAEAPFKGQILVERRLDVGDDVAQFAWLLKMSNRMVTALRLRLAARSNVALA